MLMDEHVNCRRCKKKITNTEYKYCPFCGGGTNEYIDIIDFLILCISKKKMKHELILGDKNKKKIQTYCEEELFKETGVNFIVKVIKEKDQYHVLEVLISKKQNKRGV